MGPLPKVGDLEVEQDLAFTRKVWAFQRIGWGVIGLLLVAGLSGVFGHGPLAYATVSDDQKRLTVEHDRVIRHKTEYETTFHFSPELTKGGEVRLWLSRDYLNKHDVRHMEPEPETAEVRSDRVVYTFKIAEPGQPAEVRFMVESSGYGPAPGRGGVMGGPEVDMSEFVMP